MNDADSKTSDFAIINTQIHNSSKLLSSNPQKTMNHSLHSLFRNKSWNPAIDGFKKLRKKGQFTRFVFVANSVGFYETPNKDILRDIFIKYGPLYDIYIVDNKPFANIAFVNVNDAINAYFDLNGKEHALLSRKLCLDFAEPRYPKQIVGVVPDFLHLTKHIDIPPGLILIEDYISKQQEADLLAVLDTDNVEWIDSFSRRVKHYGYQFDYDLLSIDFTQKLANIPALFIDILPHKHNKKETEQKLDDELMEYVSEIDQCTVNEYLGGQGIRPHIETTECFENYILSLSLLSPIIMDLRHSTSNVKKCILLKPRSLLIIGNESRYLWSHGISHRKYDIINGKLTERKRRVSLTFRKVKPPGNDIKNILNTPSIEAHHVHNVYDKIAPHFSHTRHTGWPQVVSFIRSVKNEYSFPMLADIGCGNGKYLKIIKSDADLRDNVYAVGMDMSHNLCKIVARRNCEVLVSDALLIPFNDNSFDAVLNIAVLHHISEIQRRVRLLAELFRITKMNGRGFICSWAYEQDGSSRHQFKKTDVFVSWNLSAKKTNVDDEDDNIVLQRYCHVYKKGELESLVGTIANIVDGENDANYNKDSNKKYNIQIIRSFYNKGNWCIEYRKY